VDATTPNVAESALLNSLADPDRLKPWLAESLGVDPQDTVLRRVSTGHTNEMIMVESGDRRWVLRRPPRTRSAATAHNVAREFRILSALQGSGVPHPVPVALCEDEDVIGAPFMIMEFVVGITAELPLPAPFDHPGEAQREMALGLVDALAAIAAVDWEAAGLQGFGKPDGFLDRQVSRWRGQLEQYRTRDIPLIDDVAAWLEDNKPETGPIGIVHGDYQWNNVLFAPDRPGRVVAVVDWEQATIGDPLLDIGWLLGLWYQPGEDAVGRDPSRLFCQLPGLPSRQELAERYAARTGLGLKYLTYYQVLALFKLACVIEGSYARFVRGQSDDPVHETFKVRVPALISRAASFAAGDIT
jgi:aminoglycoside phosphotransferase (APT) family kinase protein